MSYRKPITVALLALIAFGSVFVPADDAQARSMTQILRNRAIQAHQYAAQQTQRAGALQARLPAEAAKFATAMSSDNYNRRLYAKRAYITYLNNLKRAIGNADRAHLTAIYAFQAYIRESKNTSANATVNALASARSGFAVTIGQIDARIVNAQNA